jgi:hypothetical protein
VDAKGHDRSVWLRFLQARLASPGGGAAARYVLSSYKVFSPAESVPATLFRFLVALAWMAANTFMLAFFLHDGLSVRGARKSSRPSF